MARKKRRIPNKPEDLPMTPMIDVVFQLMIYFILTFKVPKAMANVPVFRPAPDKTKTTKKDPPRVRITVLKNGYLANEKPASLETLKGWLGGLANLDRDQNIVINVTGASEHKMLMALLDVCVEVGLKNFALFSMD
jgi:biopolymer transport protein ExbD